MKTQRFFIFLFMVIVTGCMHGYAQQKPDDVVYLKNGSIIHGSIIEVIPNESVKIQSGKNVFVYKMDEIDRITKDVRPANQPILKPWIFGLDAIYSLGFGSGSIEGSEQDNGSHGFLFHFTASYKANANFAFGLGTGYEIYPEDSKYLPKSEYIPVFAHIKTLFTTTGKVLPGLNFDIGYKIGTTTQTIQSNSSIYNFSYELKYAGGLFLNPSFNVTVNVNPKLALCFNIGYLYRNDKLKFSGTTMIYGQSYSEESSATLTDHFVNFGVGIEF
jgi:hypothetical protein